MNNAIKIRQYKSSDAQYLADIYYHTIHQVNSKDYSEKQINAWAPSSSLCTTGWKKKWKKLVPFVALKKGRIVGFAEFETNGHIDCFYVHHDYQGQGIGTCLMEKIIEKAKIEKLPRIHAEVSITARIFFELHGFKVVKKQNVNIRGIALTNFIMERAFKP